jgi:DNA ligase-1
MLVFKRLLSTTLVKRKYSPTDQLDSLYKLSTLVNNTPSTLEKHAFLREYTACHSTLKRIYDPHLRHYLSAKLVINYLEIHPELAATKPIYSNLDHLLDALSSRAITGYTARGAVASFYTTYCKTQEQQNIFWRIIDRNLKMGVSVKTIRHQLSNDPSETLSRASSNISVALASTVSNKKKNLFDLKLDDWYVSQKLDGIRCVAIIRPKQDDRNQYDIQFYSRTGRPFTSLHKVKVDIEKRLDSLSLKDEFVLDGEVCAYNAQDTENENFNKALSQVRRANEEMENPVYQVFDRICLQSFLETKGDQLFSTRQELLKTFIGNSSIQHIKLVKQTKLENLEQLNGMKEQAVQKGWEGLILRKDAPYEGKRT